MIQFECVGHASCCIRYRGFSLLTDPWFGYPINETFFSFPTVNEPSQDFIDGIDAIQISHIHRDHLCAKSLAHFHRETPIFIACYKDKTFRNRIRELGFQNIIETLPGSEGTECGPFKLHFFLPVHFDGSFDSTIVLTAGTENFLLNSDCILSPWHYHVMSAVFGEFTGCFVGYQPLLTFPICFDFSKCKSFKAGDWVDGPVNFTKTQSLDHAKMICGTLKPRWVVPYASGIRFLNSDYLKFNAVFNTRADFFNQDLCGAKGVEFFPGDIIDSSGEHMKKSSQKNARADLVSNEAIIGPRIMNTISIAAVNQRRAEYLRLFRRILEREIETWVSPITIQIDIMASDGALSLAFCFDGAELKFQDAAETAPDAIVEYKASVLEPVLAGELPLIYIQNWYMYHVRVNRYVPGQLNVHEWGRLPGRFSAG